MGHQTPIRIVTPGTIEQRCSEDAVFFHDRRALLRNSLEECQYEAASFREAAEWFWRKRSFPVLAILAPALIDSEGQVEFPGDPVCLYSGLSTAISQVVTAYEKQLSDDDPYNDYCPQWGILPDAAYRATLTASTQRQRRGPKHLFNTDQSVFDPRVWNEETAQDLKDLLIFMQPRIVFISSVSCAHRYAVDIARVVKETHPEAIVVLGGRHADETTTFDQRENLVTHAFSSTTQATLDGRIAPNIDLVLSGNSPFGVDYLIKALSLAYDPVTARIEREEIDKCLELMGQRYTGVRGQAVITSLIHPMPRVTVFLGPKFTLDETPLVYDAFGVRAHFPIFRSEGGKVMKTAHMLTVDACPYRCNFCSEGIAVVGRMQKLSADPAQVAFERTKRVIALGAEALFFDDSVAFGGKVGDLRKYCEQLISARQSIREKSSSANLSEHDARMLCLQWGAQLTAEFLSSFRDANAALVLATMMAQAGCRYIYFGIETLSEEVITDIHKNRRKSDGPTWRQKIELSLKAVKAANIQVGTAVLFGMNGENRASIDNTIDGVADLIRAGLIDLASPNIMTYHPGTEITRLHQMENKLDYHSLKHDVRPPYSFFEQAFPGVVSNQITEGDIWYIHQRAADAWGSTRNDNSSIQPSIMPGG